MKFVQHRTRAQFSTLFKRFLIMISSFSVVQLIYGTFLSTFVLRTTGSAQHVMVYNIILAAVQPLAMILAVVILRKSSAARAQQLGLLLLAVTNAYLFFQVERAAAHIYWLSAIQSIANGFYFTTYACQYVAFTTNDNRDRAAGVTGAIVNSLSLLFSFGSSILFRLYPGFAGYRVLFFISLLFSLVAFFVSFRLENLPLPDRRLHYLHAQKTFWTNKYARAALLITFIDGSRVGVMSFFLNVLLFGMIRDEVLTGINTFVTMLAGIVASAFYARFVGVSSRYRSAKYSIVAMLLATSLLLLRITPFTLILYGGINACMLPLYSTPLMNAYWTVLETLKEFHFCRPETHAAREVYYAAGRVAGIVFTMILPATNVGAVITLFCLIAIQYVGLLLSRSILSDLDRVHL